MNVPLITDWQFYAVSIPAVLLLFLAQCLLFPPRADSPSPPKWLRAVLTTTSGFTSFVAHTGGPPVSAYVLLPLAPIGVLAGVRVARRIQPRLFYRLLYIGMFLTGVKLVWDGFFGR